MIDSAKNITKFTYNHASVLILLRKFIGNKELVCPAIAHFNTIFISLQSILACILEAKMMFIADEWYASLFHKKQEG